MATSSIFKANNGARLFDLSQGSFSAFKDSCNWIGSIWIIQDHLPSYGLETKAQPAKPLLPVRVTRSQVPALRAQYSAYRTHKQALGKMKSGKHRYCLTLAVQGRVLGKMEGGMREHGLDGHVC